MFTNLANDLGHHQFAGTPHISFGPSWHHTSHAPRDTVQLAVPAEGGPRRTLGAADHDAPKDEVGQNLRAHHTEGLSLQLRLMKVQSISDS